MDDENKQAVKKPVKKKKFRTIIYGESISKFLKKEGLKLQDLPFKFSNLYQFYSGIEAMGYKVVKE